MEEETLMRNAQAADRRASDLPTDSVFILTTCVQGNLMAAVHTTREGAMAAAVGPCDATV